MHFDPEKSFKRIEKRKDKLTTRKMPAYMSFKGRAIKKKLSISLTDDQVKELILYFIARTTDLSPRDRRFPRRLLSTFKKLELPSTPPSRRVLNPRVFPYSQKDLEYLAVLTLAWQTSRR